MDLVSEAFIKYGCKVYHIDDGFYYYKHCNKNDRVFLRCVHYKTAQRCPGRINIAADVGQRTVADVRFGERPHNHPEMREWFAQQCARYRCIQRSQAEATTYRTLFNEETMQLHVNDAANLPFQAVSQAMYRARKKADLAIPATLTDYGQVLEGNPRFFSKESVPRAFYRSTLTDDNGDVAVVFVSPTIEENVGEGTTTLQVDGTFKVVPRAPASYQLMTISVVLFNHAFPLVSALMSSKTQRLYELVFAYVRQHLPRLQPTTIVCDFEQALQNGLRIHWPTANVVGCWFHSANCMNKNARRLGLTNLLRDNPFAKRVFKMCQVLALLPADRIGDGFNSVLQYAEQNAVLDVMIPFLEYVDQVWITGVGAQSLSVYRQRSRTNNHMEAYHRRLKDVMGNPHPNIWKFTDGLISLERELSVNLNSLTQGRNPYREPPLTHIATDQHIRTLTSRLDNQEYTESQFLRAASHILDSIHNPDNNVVEEIEVDDVEVQGLVPAWLPADEQPPVIAPLNLGQVVQRGRGGRGQGVRGGRGRGRGGRGQGVRGGRGGRGHQGAHLPQQNMDEDIAAAADPQAENALPMAEAGIAENNPVHVPLRCHVCLDDRRDLMLALPCNHAVVCEACQPRLEPHEDGVRCPLCRTPTERFIRILFV